MQYGLDDKYTKPETDAKRALFSLVKEKLWNKVLARIKQLPTLAAVAELFFKDESGLTTFAVASFYKAPVEVLESMILLGKLDAEKRNILDIANIDLRLPLHHIAYFHPDPAATKLLVRHNPSALLAKNTDGRTPRYYAIKFNKSPSAVALLCKLAIAYEHGHFYGLIRLCGTSYALQALAVRYTDDAPLLVLNQCDSWPAARARIEKIPTQAAIEEILEKDEKGGTAFFNAIVADAPVELLERMFELGKQDTTKREIVKVCDRDGYTTLLLAAMHRSDAATIKLLARDDPGALFFALNIALVHNKKSAAVVSLLRKCFTAWEHGNISALIDLCGESDVLLWCKEYVERHLVQVHAAAWHASDLAIIKPLIREPPLLLVPLLLVDLLNC